jgi:hypothetical protein
MAKSFILLVVGAVATALGFWWNAGLEHSEASILAALVMASGGAIIVWGIAVALDVHSPTSRKL